MSPNRNLLVSVKLKNFTKFYASKSQTKIGVDLEMLSKPFKSMEKEGILCISMNEGDNTHLNLTLRREKISNDIYTIDTLDLNEKRGYVPSPEFNIIITMKCDEFHKICKNMYNMSCTYIEIECNKNVVRFSSLGDGIRECKEYSTSDNTEDGCVHIKCYNKNNEIVSVKNVYELKHFILFGKTKYICRDVQIYLKKKFPVFLKYSVGGLGDMLVGVSPISEETLHNEVNDDDSYDPTDPTYYKRTEIKAIDE